MAGLHAQEELVVRDDDGDLVATYDQMVDFANRVMYFQWDAVREASEDDGSMGFAAYATLNTGRVVEFRRLRITNPRGTVERGCGAGTLDRYIRELVVELLDPVYVKEEIDSVTVTSRLSLSKRSHPGSPHGAFHNAFHAPMHRVTFRAGRRVDGAVTVYLSGKRDDVGAELIVFTNEDTVGASVKSDAPPSLSYVVSIYVAAGRGVGESASAGFVDLTANACGACGVRGAEFHCSGCSTTVYCGAACQTRAWPAHGNECAKP